MGLRKPQREDSHLGPVKASLVLRDGRTRSWRGRESHGKRAALVARGLPLVKGHRRPGWPRSPIQALQHLSPNQGTRARWSRVCGGAGGTSGRSPAWVITSVSLHCQESGQRCA